LNVTAALLAGRRQGWRRDGREHGVPYGQITSVRWEPMPNDIANHWVAVRFTNDDGKEDGRGPILREMFAALQSPR
jgi:hypothetical protein